MKSNSIFLFYVTLVTGLCCCSPKGDSSLSEVIVNGKKMYITSLNELKSNVVSVPLSYLVEDCYLVQLETKEEAYFRPWFTTVTEKYIGIRDKQSRPYKLFDRSGKFLCSVGAIGRGPGEYSDILYDDIIDDENSLIYLAPFTGNKIYVYNTSGQFVKDIVSPQDLVKPKLFLSDNILTVVHMPMIFEYNPDVNLSDAISIQFDVNTGNVLRKLAPSSHFIVPDFDGEIFNTRNAPDIFDFLQTSCDTLYHLDVKNNKILPFFKIKYTSSDQSYKQIFQINKDLVITHVWGDKGGFVASDLKRKSSSWLTVVNDYYGNMTVPISPVTFRNGYWVLNIQSEDLMEDIEKHLEKVSLSDKDRQVLKRTLSTLKEGTNNVVFIGKLKNEVKTKLW